MFFTETNLYVPLFIYLFIHLGQSHTKIELNDGFVSISIPDEYEWSLQDFSDAHVKKEWGGVELYPEHIFWIWLIVIVFLPAQFLIDYKNIECCVGY